MTQQGNILNSNNNLTNIENNFALLAGEIRQLKSVMQPTDITNAINSVKRNIGEVVQSTIPLSDAGLHLLDGALISGSGAYADFVDYIADIYDASANYFCSESDWQTSVTNYGVCDKFVYDSVNSTVRLPKYDNKLITKLPTELAVKGNGNSLGLTDGTNNLGIGGSGSSGYTGYVTANTRYYDKTTGSVQTGGTWCINNASLGVVTNAEKSGIVAEVNNLSSKASEVYYYIVIATGIKTEIEVDIDEIVTDLNGKADVDLSNASPVHSFATALNNATIRTVVETYHNGSSWYRVWSDGFIEQGGQTGSIASSSNSYQIVLNKTMGNTDYNIFMLGCWTNATTSGSNASYQGVSRYIGNPVAKTTSSFTCQVASTEGSYSWFVCGY